ncbi:dUTP diphosphatase, partial [bacterium]|nr:dUTP diphosphatase [bacterium]
QSAAMDLRACLSEALELMPGQTQMISSGIAIYLNDPQFAALVLPRSGLGAKGLVLGNLVGLIDADYQGALMMACWNRGAAPILITPGDRIAQLMVVPIARVAFEQVAEFVTSERGAGGYGHTGLR